MTSATARSRYGWLLIASVLALACIATLHAQPSLQITSPANGTVFSPGQTITVSVSASAGLSSIFIVGQNPIGFTAPVYTAPYQFSIQLPMTIRPKQYMLTAEGVISPGQLVKSAPITIVVQRTDSPVNLEVQPSVLKLNVGSKAYLRVIGTYRDGTTSDLTQAANTTFVSNAPAIATVSAQGTVTAVSSGTTTILVNGSVQVPVTVAPAVKVAPPQKALYASQSQQFYPTLADASVPSVSWSLNPSLGSISGAGLYTAPFSITTQQAVVLTATSTSNNTISAQSTITLLPQLAMSLSPGSVNLFPSQAVQFYASLSNTVNYGLNWSITPNVGQVGILGLYTAPASITSPQTVTVKATSTVDGVTAATASINLQPLVATVTTASNVSVIYSASSQTVALSAMVTSTGGTVSTGTVTFTVKQGTTVVGSPVTSGTVTNGIAGANFPLPGGTAANTYTIQAVYNPGTGFLTSSDSAHTLTITSGASGNVYSVDGGNNRVEVFSSTGAYLSQFGTFGTGNGQLNGPRSIAIDAGGNIWLVDFGNDRVQEFSSSGTYLSQFGSYGSGNGQFSYPGGIAFAANGNIYVVDGGNNRVQVFSSTGAYLSQLGTFGTGNGQLNGPTNIAIDASGNIWLVDFGNDRVQEFSSSGTYVSQFGSYGSGNGQFSYPGGIAIH